MNRPLETGVGASRSACDMEHDADDQSKAERGRHTVMGRAGCAVDAASLTGSCGFENRLTRARFQDASSGTPMPAFFLLHAAAP